LERTHGLEERESVKLLRPCVGETQTKLNGNILNRGADGPKIWIVQVRIRVRVIVGVLFAVARKEAGQQRGGDEGMRGVEAKGCQKVKTK
jgi:hypothetical protein